MKLQEVKKRGNPCTNSAQVLMRTEGSLLLYFTLHSSHYSIAYTVHRNAKTQYRKFETNITRKGMVRPQSQFPHSCVCERFTYSHDRSAYSAAGKYVDRSWEYINRSQTHECGNCQIGTEAEQFPERKYTSMGFSLQCALRTKFITLSTF